MSVRYPDCWGGLESPDCPNYVPIKHELIVLGQYWLNERWLNEMNVFYGEPSTGASGGSSPRR